MERNTDFSINTHKKNVITQGQIISYREQNVLKQNAWIVEWNTEISINTQMNSVIKKEQDAQEFLVSCVGIY